VVDTRHKNTTKK